MSTYYDIGIASLYGNPPHEGHIAYLNAVSEQASYIIAIVNNDIQVGLKESLPVLNQNTRKILIENFKMVDQAFLSLDQDDSVSETIKFIYNLYIVQGHAQHEIFNEENENPTICFCNSGDRDETNWNKKEMKVCEELGIDTLFIKMPKINSSYDIMSKVVQYLVDHAK